MSDLMTFRKIQERIISCPELRGARIGYYNNGQCNVLHPGIASSDNYRLMIVIEYTDRNLNVGPLGNTASQLQNPDKVLDKTPLGAEIAGTLISCGAAGIGLAFGTLAFVPSAGVSTTVIVASWITAAQCVNGIFRSTVAHTNSKALEQLDQNKAYKYGSLAVDATGVVLGGGSLKNAASSFYKKMALKNALPSKAVLSSLDEVTKTKLISSSLKGVEKKGLEGQLKDTVKYISSSKLNRMKNGNTIVIRQHYDTIKNVIDADTAKALTNTILAEVLPYSVQTGANALPQELVGSASGIINYSFTEGPKDAAYLYNETKNYIIHITTD